MIILRILCLNQSIPDSHSQEKKSLRLLKNKIPSKITSFISPYFLVARYTLLDTNFNIRHSLYKYIPLYIYVYVYLRLLLAKYRIPLNIVGISLFNRKAKEIKKNPTGYCISVILVRFTKKGGNKFG